MELPIAAGFPIPEGATISVEVSAKFLLSSNGNPFVTVGLVGLAIKGCSLEPVKELADAEVLGDSAGADDASEGCVDVGPEEGAVPNEDGEVALPIEAPLCWSTEEPMSACTPEGVASCGILPRGALGEGDCSLFESILLSFYHYFTYVYTTTSTSFFQLK
ncbi:hypothetical protein IKF04_00450 [Candidatus Saccharibacteria bacterium]|nr:hypothetical protein [Candidatus Saccharibacteria bacterium]